MDTTQKKRDSSPSNVSMKSDHSKSHPPNFSQDPDSEEDWRPPCPEKDKMDTMHQERDKSLGCSSLKSCRSKSPPLAFKPGTIEDRQDVNVSPQGAHLPVGGAQTRGNYLDEFPPTIDDWTKEQVKDWLILSLRIPQHIAQKLCDQELSGACLVSFEKQDLLELGVPPAPAIQIIRQVEKLKSHTGTFGGSVRIPKSHCEPESGEHRASTDTQDVSGNLDESMETETVSSDSGIQSLSSTVSIIQTLRHKIKSVTDDRTTDDKRLNRENTEDATSQPLRKPISLTRPFDKSDPSFIYKQNDILPPIAGPSNLLDPVHEYQLLPNTNEASEREILYEFTKEVFCFAASCMNSRTNGTIHFGVKIQSGQAHGQVIGHKVTSFSKYQEAFESCLNEHFQEDRNVARACIRPPKFFQVHNQYGTTSDKWVIEVDVVPTYSETKEKVFYTVLNIASIEKEQQCKTECLFVREGLRAVNILSDPNPRIVQEKIKSITDKVKCWAAARNSVEEKNDRHLTQGHQGHQGQRLKQIITRGRDLLENSTEVIVVTNKCHSSQLEHLGFLKEMKLFAVLEFDPESDVDGTCSFYRRDRIANLHYPQMYVTQDSIPTVIGKLNLFKQTSWVFCNGRVNEESEIDKPLTTSEWLKKRSGDVTNMVSFLCNPDLLSKDRLLVVFILHSAITDISSPLMETFCAIYRTLEGDDNMLCICKDTNVFRDWKQMVETRCKVDITGKCIYELSLNEINSTIQKLKEPQTRSSRRYLPSSASSSVLLTKRDEELMTVLDILSENECENTEIETNESFQEFKKKTEEDFYRGGQVTWWNFYLSERPGCHPFIKRDKYQELYDLITPVQGYTSPCVMINLFHHPGCGGTTLAMHVLWSLRRKFRCAVVKNNIAQNSEIAVQVKNLLTYGKQEESGYTPVLLLVDNWDDVEELKQCILSVGSERKQNSNVMVIILNCERSQFPDESSRNSRTANVFITNKLSTQEQSLFSEKLRQLKAYHDQPETFYAFMIMTKNFSEDYIKNLVSNIVKDLDTTTQKGKLFSFLAVLNTYVNGSYISLSLCEELVGIRNAFWKRETLEEKMNPYSTLLINFIVEEHGTYQAVRFLHQLIASNCLEVLAQKHKLSLAEITINLLHCDCLYKSFMGKDILIQNIQSMLITRHRKEQGGDKDTLFSPLIEAIDEEEGPDKIKEVLEKAIVRFDRSATLPQALARHFYLKEKDFKSAIQWARDAQRKNPVNSYIADTVGQVYKSQLKQEIVEHSDGITPEALNTCLQLASCAINAFKDSQELAKKDEPVDQFDLHNKKRKKSYNTSGYVGETEVMMTLLEVIKDIPLFNGRDRYKRDTMLQFLNGHFPAKNFHEINNTTMDQFVAVLADHERFLVSLKPSLKAMFSFFENYFTYLKPRSLERETTDERNKRKVSEHFKKYVDIFCISGEEKASEKDNNPKLSLLQQIADKKNYLESKRADTFAGLLQCLYEKTGKEMEYILNKWLFVFDNSPNRYISDTVNLILANIVLHDIKPNSKTLKKYTELVSLLNEALQNEGIHSKCTELYYLSMLLIWPTKDHRLEDVEAYKNISTYVTSARKSFHRRFSHMFPARSAIAHFFLGKSTGLERIVSKAKLDHIVSSASQQRSQCDMHQLWLTGAVWKEPEVQKMLLRVKGKSENSDIYVSYAGNLKMLVRPAYLGGIRGGYSQEKVSFYLGFSMEGPVAYDIRYENA
ncbi:sterile alpha motif domain-containing protein 9-like isoform X2 [Myripristis murdjan]|uniref:sterile alpha motif domain-containing protein 9-like isoform X2 n=1 Tax=Myripristis murdjan TaxID=586833 RepID=UPI001175E660|nr:sterile alpha motif domain-containing protein 9-like isoform X2 [Myripristis murdjan]